MNQTQRLLVVIVVSLSAMVACATSHPGPSTAPVTYAGPPDPPSNVLLATTTTAAPAGEPGSTSEYGPSSQGDGAYREALARGVQVLQGARRGQERRLHPHPRQRRSKLYGLVLVTVAGRGLRDRRRARRVLDPVGQQAVHRGPRHRDGGRRHGRQAHRRQRHGPEVQLDPRHRSAQEPPADKDTSPRGQPAGQPGRDRRRSTCSVPRAAMDKWSVIMGNLEAFAGRRLTVNDEVYRSESETNTHNRAIVQLLKDYEVIKGDPLQALDLYTRQCSVSVSARDLAIMGATLANGGRNPLTGVQVVSPPTAAQGAGDRSRRQASTRRRASGSTRSACRPRAAWAAASSPSCPGRFAVGTLLAAARRGGQQRARPARRSRRS